MIDEIVVTAPAPYSPPPDPAPYLQSTPTGGPPPPGSPGGPPPTTLEPAAISYAADRVKKHASLDPNDPAQAAWLAAGEAAMKGLYFNTQFGSKTEIDGAGSKDVSEGNFLNILNHTTFVFQTDPVIFQGQEVAAKATAYSDGQYIIFVDVDHASSLAMAAMGEAGMNFLLFHEIGHAVAHANGWAQSPTAEADANTFAMGLADYAYFGIPTQQSLSALGYVFSPF